MRHRNGLGIIPVGEGARSSGTMNGNTADQIGSGEGEKVPVGKVDEPVDEVSLSSSSSYTFSRRTKLTAT